VIVNNFHTKNLATLPAKTDPPLIIDADAVLTLPLALQRLQSIPGRDTKITETHGSMQIQEFPSCDPFDVSETSDIPVVKQCLGLPTTKGPNHSPNLLRCS
jgi:hypothetical protein